MAPGSPSQALLESGQITRLLNNPGLSEHNASLLALIETPEAMEAYLLRARSQDDARRRAQRLVQAVEQARRLAKLR